MMEAIEETGSKAKLGLSGTDWMDYKQGTPGPGTYNGEKSPRKPVSTITFPTGGRDAQKKIFISSLHSKADGESCSSGPGKYNCSRDFSTGLLEDINEERKRDQDKPYNAKIKKKVKPGIGIPLSTRNGDGKRLILRTMAPSGATDKNPAPGQYTPRRDYRGNVGMCTETRSVKWTKPKLKEKGKDQDSLGPGQYSTVYTQVSAEAPKISFSTTPRSTNLSIGALDTPAPAAYGIPSLASPPKCTIGRADRTKEQLKVFQGKKFMADAIGLYSPGPIYENTDRVDYKMSPRATVGRSDRFAADKQYTGGGSNFINDGGVTMQSLKGLGPGAYDIAKSSLNPRGGVMVKAQRPDITGGNGLGQPGPGSYTPTTKSVFDRPGYSMAGARPPKNNMSEVPGPGTYLDQSLQSYTRAYAPKPAQSFTKATPSPRQYMPQAPVKGADAPGSGQYNVGRKASWVEKPATAWGQSKTSRFKNSGSSSVPGPGDYASTNEASPRADKGQSFGKSKRVFSFIKASAAPGPSHYNPTIPTMNTPRASMGSGERYNFAKVKF